jgi:hypothetical protein
MRSILFRVGTAASASSIGEPPVAESAPVGSDFHRRSNIAGVRIRARLQPRRSDIHSDGHPLRGSWKRGPSRPTKAPQKASGL